MARDVIVIGAGGGGPVVAKELAARGLDVLLLEAGGVHSDPEHDWTRFENDANNFLTGYLRFGPADRTQPAWLREIPMSGLLEQVSGVGGTTKHYFGNCPRSMPGTFSGYDGADRAAYDTAHLFPFNYEDLLPHYRWVEATLPVQTAPMGTKESVFFRGAEGLGLPHNRSKDVTGNSFRPQENAILQPGGTAGKTHDPARLHWPQATGCTFCGHCFQGCLSPRSAPRNLKAKRSTDNSYVPMALSASAWSAGGRDATLVVDAFVTKVHTGVEAGALTARAVSWRSGADGVTSTEDARVIVLAAGAIETPRLWLNAGLPDPYGWVGRGLTDHAFDWVIGTFPFQTGTTKGPASAARVDYPGRGVLMNAGLPPALQALTSGFSDGGIAGHYDNGLSLTAGADITGRLAGRPMAQRMEQLDRLLNILVLTDDDVELGNQVSRSTGYPADEHGQIPRVFINHRNRSARTTTNREFLVRRAVELLRAAGATSVQRVQFPPLMLHLQSSMRMGADPATSVCSEDGQSRAVRRLYIADNSVLANSAGGVNPTLTTQAIATRTAERIFRDHFGGDPWVSTEAPVCSTDGRVSA
jgi:choline dehydrogenase-like flavoprotein